MNASWIKKIAATFVGILLSTSAWAGPATPVKYCESLAATSCEVLNIELGSCSTQGCGGLVKYCRNQKLLVIPLYYIMGSSDAYTKLYVGGTNIATSQMANPTIVAAANSTTLCSTLP